MMSESVAIQIAKGMLESGELPDAAAANVEVVRMMGVSIIRGRIPADARKALNAAVKAGKLGRMAKDGLKPEAYFHPNARAHASDLRAKAARESIEALKAVYVHHRDIVD